MKQLKIIILFWASVLSAPADVILTSNTNSITVNQGDSFTLTLSMVITGGDQVVGLTYFWKANASASGFLTLTERETGSSPFSDLTSSDESVQSVTLSPRNNRDLGATISDVNSPIGSGVWLVASYSFLTDRSLPQGNYTLEVSGPSDSWVPIWVGPSPNFSENAFSNLGSINLTVVPEPSTVLLLAFSMGIIGWVSGRQKCRCCDCMGLMWRNRISREWQ